MTIAEMIKAVRELQNSAYEIVKAEEANNNRHRNWSRCMYGFCQGAEIGLEEAESTLKEIRGVVSEESRKIIDKLLGESK